MEAKPEAPKPPPGKRRGPMIAVAVVVIIVIAVAGLYFAKLPPFGGGPCTPNKTATLVFTSSGAQFSVNGSTLGGYGPTLNFSRGDCVQITLRNSDTQAHDLTILKVNVAESSLGTQVATGDPNIYVQTPDGQAGVPAQQSATLRFDAKDAGTYFYLCSISGHRTSGLRGQITVT